MTAVVYTLICVTDFLDGYLARKLNIETDLGKILDPLADKILVLVFLISLIFPFYYLSHFIYYYLI